MESTWGVGTWGGAYGGGTWGGTRGSTWGGGPGGAPGGAVPGSLPAAVLPGRVAVPVPLLLHLQEVEVADVAVAHLLVLDSHHLHPPEPQTAQQPRQPRRRQRPVGSVQPEELLQVIAVLLRRVFGQRRRLRFTPNPRAPQQRQQPRAQQQKPGGARGARGPDGRAEGGGGGEQRRQRGAVRAPAGRIPSPCLSFPPVAVGSPPSVPQFPHCAPPMGSEGRRQRGDVGDGDLCPVRARWDLRSNNPPPPFPST